MGGCTCCCVSMPSVLFLGLFHKTLHKAHTYMVHIQDRIESVAAELVESQQHNASIEQNWMALQVCITNHG